MKTWFRRIAFALAIAFVVLTFVNASWLAPTPRGNVKLIAHRGVYQAYDHRGQQNDTCTAARIEQPVHDYIENTIPSLQRAARLGATMVELDIAPTRDGRIVVFHDWTLDCHTEASGPTLEHTLEQIARIDAGHGYTADGGETFPLRGKGVGMIPALEDFVRAAGRTRLIYNFKSPNPAEADLLAAALKAAGRDPEKAGDAFYGGPEGGPVARIREHFPQAWAFSRERAEQCTRDYAVLGWLGITPEACRGGTLIVPLDYQWALAGWPNRTIARMEAVGATILMAGPQGEGERPMGLDRPEQIGDVPASFNG